MSGYATEGMGKDLSQQLDIVRVEVAVDRNCCSEGRHPRRSRSSHSRVALDCVVVTIGGLSSWIRSL